MPLTAAALSSAVFANYLSNFPSALSAIRQNPTTGVISHCIPEVFIGALCEALVTVLKAATIKDLGSGTTDVPGAAPPATFTFAGVSAAEAQFIAQQAWTGPQAALGAACLIGAPLTLAAGMSTLQMVPNLMMGTGTGVVSPASNPTLEAEMSVALATALAAQFQATGKFGEGDVPSAPVNATLAAQLPRYAAALAKGIATITATVAYVGNTSTTVPITGVVNTGSIL